MWGTKNKNDIIQLVVTLGILTIIAVVAIGFLSHLGLLPNIFNDNLLFGKGKVVIVEDSVKRTVDPWDLESEIITGEVKNTSIFSVKKAMVNIYFLDYSGIECMADSILLYNIKPKSTVEFKTRLESFMHVYGVSKVYATVEVL